MQGYQSEDSPSPNVQKSMRDLKKGKHKKALNRFTRRIFDCKRCCGFEDKFILHAWTWFMMIESLIIFILYNTDVFGHFCQNRGLLSVYSVMYASLGIACVYFWYIVDTTDPGFKLEWLVKLHLYTLIAGCVMYALDALLWNLDKHMFCTLQAENSMSCDDRN